MKTTILFLLALNGCSADVFSSGEGDRQGYGPTLSPPGPRMNIPAAGQPDIHPDPQEFSRVPGWAEDGGPADGGLDTVCIVSDGAGGSVTYRLDHQTQVRSWTFTDTVPCDGTFTSTGDTSDRLHCGYNWAWMTYHPMERTITDFYGSWDRACL